MRKHSTLVVALLLGMTSPALTEEGPTPAQSQATERANKQAEKLVNRQLDAIQQRLAQEEKRIEARLKQLSNMREKALKKEDSESLKRIEALEKQAISNYDAQITKIIEASEKQTANAVSQANRSVQNVPQQPRPPRTGAPRRQNNNAAAESRSNANKREEEDRQQRQSKPRRRFRLWPF